VRIMTFNLRFENDMDGSNAWSFRRELVIHVIKRHKPAILGTQEGMWPQLEFIRDNLPEYHLHSPDRVLDGTSQYPTLFFLKDRFSIHEGGEFWLSETPKVHRSKSWDSAFPRMMNYARVSENNNGHPFWVAVTHLDHMGAKARYEQAKILAQWVKARKGPVILMGDFNDSPGSPSHALLTSKETGLLDTWEILDGKEDKSSFTQHGFTGVPRKTRMDWILVSAHFHVTETKIIKDHLGNRYPSDHFPYMVELRMKN